MSQIRQTIEMQRGAWNASGTTSTYFELPAISTVLNMSDFDGTVSVYFEAQLLNQGAVTDTTYVELYNHTDSLSVTSSELSTSTKNFPLRLRSGPLSLSGNKLYTVRIRHTSVTGSNAQIYGARLIIYQSGNITKTQIHQELGAEQGVSSTSSTNLPDKNMLFLYEATKYDGTVTVRHDAVLQTTSGNTATSGIYDVTAGSVVASSEVAVTNNTSYTYAQGSNITLTDGHVYRPTAYVSAGATVFSEGSKLVFTITGGFTKFLAYSQVMTSDGTNNNATTNYPSFNAWVDDYTNIAYDEFADCNLVTYHEALLALTDATKTAYADLGIYSYGTAVTDLTATIVSVTGSTPAQRVRSSAFSLPGGTNDISSGVSSNAGSNNAILYNSYIIAEVSGITNGTARSDRAQVMEGGGYSEEATVTESVQVFITSGFPSVTLSDSVTVSENRALSLSIDVNKTDSVSVSETVQMQLESARSVSDTAATAETINVALVHTINVSDTASHTESVSAVPSYDQSVSDTATVSESRSVDIPLLIAVTQAVTLTENVQRQLISTNTFGKTTDGAGSSASSLDKEFVSTATPPSSGQVISGTARIWLSATGSTKAKFVIYADSGGTAGALLATSDEVTLTNPPTTEQAITFVFSGAQQINITSGTPYWIGPVWQDPGTPSVNVSRDSTASMRLEQALTYPTIPDPFGTPSATNSGPIDAYVTYNTTSTDLAVTVNEQPVITENSIVDVPLSVTVTDTTTLSETLLRVLESNRLVSDSATVSESVALQELGFVTVSDSSTVSENTSAFLTPLVINKSDSVTVSESVNRSLAISIAVAELYNFAVGTNSIVASSTDIKGLGYSGTEQKIAKNSGGRLFVAYRTLLSGTYEPYLSYSDNGTSWTAVNVANITTDHQRVPSIALDSSDAIHFVWYGKDPSNTGTDQRQIKYAKSTDNGATWSAWISVGGDVSGYDGVSVLWQEHPAILATSTSNLFAVWEGRDASHLTAQQVKFSKSTDGGASWSAWANIAGNGSRPGIVRTSDGTLHVLFYSSDATSGSVQQIQHVTSTNSGTSWSANTIIGNTGFDARHVSVINDGTNLHAVWRQTDATYATTQIYYSKYTGTWSAPAVVSPIPGRWQMFPKIGLPNAIPTVVWLETNQGYGYPSEDPTSGLIFISQFVNGGWTARQQLTTSGSELYPYIAGTSYDTIYSTGTVSPYDYRYAALSPNAAGISVSEIPTVGLDVLANTTDTVSVSESRTLLIANTLSVTDTSSVSESVSLLQANLAINTSQSVTITESISVAVTIEVAATDSSTVTEAVTLQLHSNIVASDAAGVAENKAAMLESNRAVSDSSTISESTTVRLESAINVTDVTTLTEAVSLLIPTLAITIADTATVAESPNVILPQAGVNLVNVSESVAVSESLSLQLPFLTLSVADSTTITDIASLVVPVSVATQETVLTSESVSVFVPFMLITQSQAVTTTESVNVVVLQDGTVVLSEPVSVTEAVSLLIPTLFISKTESASVSETVSRYLESQVTVTNTVTTAENLGIIVPTLLVNVGETVAHTESLGFKFLILLLSISDSVAVAEALTMLAPPIRTAYGDSVDSLHTGDPSHAAFTPATSGDDSVGALHTGDPSGQAGIPTVYNTDVITGLKG